MRGTRKTSTRILSFVLSLIMVASTFMTDYTIARASEAVEETVTSETSSSDDVSETSDDTSEVEETSEAEESESTEAADDEKVAEDDAEATDGEEVVGDDAEATDDEEVTGDDTEATEDDVEGEDAEATEDEEVVEGEEELTEEEILEEEIVEIVGDTIKISFKASEGGSVSMSQQTLGEEDEVEAVTATADEGYEFVNWTKDGEEVSASEEFTPAKEEATYVANFEEVEEEYPAQSFEDGADNGITVKAYVEEGVFPKNTRMVVTSVSKNEAMDAVKDAATEGKEIVDVQAVDITFVGANGNELQPTDGKKVQVVLSSDKKVDGDSYAVVHVEDNGDAEQIAGASTDEAAFIADSFSIYALVGERKVADRITFVFKNDDGSEIDSQIVKDGETLYEPAIPTSTKNAGDFIGWYKSGDEVTFDGFGTVSVNGTYEVVLTAKYGKAYNVYFYNQFGVVQTTKTVQNGSSVDTTDVALAVGTTEALVGWTLTKGSDTVVKTVSVNGADVNLYPVIKTAAWITFDTDGGSYIEPAYVLYNEKTVKPANPEKYGYEFAGWYTSNIYNKQFTFGNTLSESVTVYAKWNPKKVDYKVVTWLENANDDGYSFESIVTKQANAGSTTNITAPAKQGFTVVPVEQQVVKGDGTTIVNVYYKRNVYRIEFKKEKSSGWWSSTWKIIDELTITAKYQENIAHLWPSRREGLSTTYPAKWYVSSNGTTWQAGIDVMPMNGDTFYYKEPSGRYIAEIQYYVRGIDMAWVLDHIDEIDVSSSEESTKEDYYPIEGFECDMQLSPRVGSYFTSGTKLNNGHYAFKIYYNRNTYNITFNNGTDAPSSFTKKFEESIANVGYTPTRPANIPAGYEFAGWYDNKDGYGEAYDFTGKTMPANNLIFYAKWAAPTFEVSFDTAGGTGNADTQTVSLGACAVQPMNPVKDGYTFAGWMKDGKPFNFATQITADTKLVASWIYNEKLTISYDAGEGSGAPADNKYYVEGSYAKVLRAPSTIPTGKVFLGWSVGGKTYYPNESYMVSSVHAVNDEITLRAEYGAIPSSTGITYYANNGTGTSISFDKIKNNSTIVLKTAKELGFAKEHYAFDCWKDAEGNVYAAGESVVVDIISENTLTAQWKPIEYTITYVLNGGSLSTANRTKYTIETETFALNNPTREGYEFKGWTGTGLNSATTDVKVEKGSTGNRTYTATWEVNKVDVSVKKAWNDADNQDGIRPESVEVQLYADGVPSGSAVTLNKDNSWAYTWNVAAYNNDKAVVYTVDEVAVPTGYAKAVTGDATNGFVITNTHTPELTEATVKKVWDDAEDQDGIRPESVEVQLYANSDAQGTPITLNAANQWTVTVENLNKNADGKAIAYTWKETLPEESGYTLKSNETIGTVTTLTNTHTPAKVYVSGTKTWNDADDQDGARPSSITVRLWADGKEVDSKTVTEKEGWKYKFDNLNKNAAGKEIRYTVTEDEVEGYTSTVDGFNITNTHTPAKVNVSGTKVWNDADYVKIKGYERPKSVTIILTAKVGNDTVADLRTQTVTAEDEWKFSFTDLPKFYKGSEITYTLSEDQVPGYTYSVDPETNTITNTPVFAENIINPVTLKISKIDKATRESLAGAKFTITNAQNEKIGDVVTNENGFASVELSTAGKYTITETSAPVGYNATNTSYTVNVTESGVVDAKLNGNVWEKAYNLLFTNNDFTGDTLTIENTLKTVTISGTKTWNDAENQDGKRPESITVRLLADGTEVNHQIVTADNWTYEFKDVPEYANGELIQYTVTEDAVEGYETTVNGYNITNTHTPEVVSVSGTKVWNDADNQDGIRPESITVNLYANKQKVKTTTATANTGWKWSFNNLPKYAAGKEIAYTYAEEVVEGYAVSYATGNEIINTHTLETVDVSGEKAWVDAENQDGKRPESITVRLLADGTEVDSQIVTAEDEWKYSFTGLTKNRTGKVSEPIVYTITEDEVTGYATVYDGYNITNTHTPEVVSVSGTKTWEDADDQDGIRPDSITVNLLADGEVVDTVTTSENANWTYEFANLPKYRDGGVEIVYTVEEEAVTGYTTAINGYNITNTHEPATFDIEGTKTWEDADDQDGIRPDSITVKLLADGTETSSVEVKAANGWAYKFTDAPKYRDGGVEIVYTVEEEAVAGYTTAINGYNITNTHTPEVVSVSGTKTWEDADDQDGIRPDSITVNLLADGEVVDTATTSENANWTYEFANLPKYRDGGVEIVYTVEEEAVTGYTTAINGYNITNTHTPEVVSVSGTKTWEDADNQDGVRPIDITVNLLADGEVVGTATTSENDNWTYEFANLPKYRDGGVEIVYTVEEEAVTGYTTEINDYNITNTHIPETIEISGTKVWVDNNNALDLRPDAVQVQLYADGEAVEESVATIVENVANGEWKYTFTDLPKYKAGAVKQEIVYSVQEVAVPEYYNVSYSGTVEEGFTVTNTLVDLPSVELTKVSSANTDLKLSGATFELYKASDDTEVADVLLGTYTTDAEGKIVVDNLTKGNYYFTETVAPSGYVLGTGATTFVVDDTNFGAEAVDVTITVTNAPVPPTGGGGTGGGSSSGGGRSSADVGRVLGARREDIATAGEEGQVLGAVRAPKTSDSSRAILWMLVMGTSALGAAAILAQKKNEEEN